MIVTKENERLYPATWGYNAALITSALAEIVESNGGRVKYGNAAIISNRTITYAVIEREERLNRLKKLNDESSDESKKEIRAAVIKALKKEIEELKQINNDPRRVTHTGYITFIFENNYYYFQVDSNPFLDFRYIKTPVNNGKYSQDACSMEDKKDWFYDDLLKWDRSDAEIKDVAQMIFNMLINAPFSVIRRDGRRARVRNLYNDGYHYETIYAPERIGKITF